MPDITEQHDVVDRLGRPLTPDEVVLCGTLIGDAENMIRVRCPGRSLADQDPSLVRQVTAAAVVRVLRNPDGYRSETVGGVSYSIDTRAAAGFLTILDDEWALLGLAPLSSSGSAGSFAPTLGVAHGTPSWRQHPGWDSWL